jgi:hypothetical protein
VNGNKGLMHGDGEYTWPNGKVYVGSWRKGKMHGNGKMTSNGKTVKGEWVDGKLKKE